jgi:dihydrodipicolinate synthase/N-acetylneuraminate lyase
MTSHPLPPTWVLNALRQGLVIPAHPLALTPSRKLDERRQCALTRYYHAAGAGGVAVGVHTTQFEIRRPEHSLFRPVLNLAAATVAACDADSGHRTVRVGGVCGRTRQALTEARFLREAGYHAGLLSLAAFPEASEHVILDHCQTVAREIPLIGFYLQPAVGGRFLSVDFWRRFAEIPNVLAIKIAAFNRYQTFDVVRAVAEVGRAGEIALYSGNDDNIVVDLLTEYKIQVGGRIVQQRFAGGLLGHWACWTSRAVKVFEACRRQREKSSFPQSLLTLAAQVTDCNAAFFDAPHQFAGCIAGIHEVLRRQGLLKNLVCLEPNQCLSQGQREEIDRVYRSYPELNDDDFVRKHLDDWLKG